MKAALRFPSFKRLLICWNKHYTWEIPLPGRHSSFQECWSTCVERNRRRVKLEIWSSKTQQVYAVVVVVARGCSILRIMQLKYYIYINVNPTHGAVFCLRSGWCSHLSGQVCILQVRFGIPTGVTKKSTILWDGITGSIFLVGYLCGSLDPEVGGSMLLCS
jgi:hypothetical protein